MTVTAKEVYESVQKMFAAESEALALDEMLYGRAIICFSSEGISRIPPEDWPTLTVDIVAPKK